MAILEYVGRDTLSGTSIHHGTLQLSPSCQTFPDSYQATKLKALLEKI